MTGERITEADALKTNPTIQEGFQDYYLELYNERDKGTTCEREERAFAAGFAFARRILKSLGK